MQPITAETPILLLGDDDAPVLTTVGEFFADNGFDAEWRAEIVDGLQARDCYLGGGGAQPEWVVRRCRAPIDPRDIAPASARKLAASFEIHQSGDLWEVVQRTSWRDDRDGGCWDGEFSTLAEGLSEADARAIAAGLCGLHPAVAA